VQLSASDASAAADLEATGVSAPPLALVERLSLDTNFYTRYLNAGGIPVLSSQNTSPYALAEVRWIMGRMLEQREDIATSISRQSGRVAIMAVDEYVTDIPEHSVGLLPRIWWNSRSRGLGAVPQRPVLVVSSEDVLSLDGDHSVGESILVHEIAHMMHLIGLNSLEPGFDGRLKEIFAQARAEGLWEGTYAAVNSREYFAEGVQSWFDTNRDDNSLHGPIDTRDELVSYDPRLAALLTDVFGDNSWRYVPPQERGTGVGPLAGFDRAAEPTFVWPAHLQGIDISRRPEFNRLDEDWSNVGSPRGSTRLVKLFIDNRRSTAVTFHWVDFDGRRLPFATVPAGKKWDPISTFIGHRLEVTDDKGVVIGRYSIGDTDRGALIFLEDPVEPMNIEPARRTLTNHLSEDWSNARSPRVASPLTSVSFVNKRSTTVGRRWVNFDGQRVAYSPIEAGETRRQTTRTGHLWEVTDDSGAVIGRYSATSAGEGGMIVLEE